jgi:hypothetical protein
MPAGISAALAHGCSAGGGAISIVTYAACLFDLAKGGARLGAAAAYSLINYAQLLSGVDVWPVWPGLEHRDGG